MKNLAILAVVLLVILPKAFAQEVSSKMLAADDKVKASKTISLIGQWGQYVIAWNKYKKVSKNKFSEIKSELYCNACPVITFRADSTGLFKFPDNSCEEFQWQLIGDNLTIRNISALLKDGNLGNGIYKVVVYQTNQRFVEIALVNNRGTSYIMRK